jgi:hypothetical protein
MTTAKRIRAVGAGVLWAGLLAAVIIFATARREEGAGVVGVDVPTKRDRLQLERMGGQSYVLFKDLDDWFASLWHGRRLGATVGVLSVLGFLVCRGLARVHEDETAAENEGRQGRE